MLDPHSALPSASCRTLGFVVNELITNAAKHGEGRIAVCLERNLGTGYVLSVSNDVPALPDGFDPTARNQSLVGRIGELLIGCGDQGQGARFPVLFS